MSDAPNKALQTMINNLPEKTGKSLDEWLKITRSSGLAKHGELMKLLKGDHGVTHGFANLIASKTLASDEDIDLVATQYAGPKAGLRPLHDEIVKFAKSLGADVQIAPKKTSVSLRRKKQFTLITPATKSRIDLGLALKGEEAKGRLETYNAMCSHRVRLESADDFDKEVKAWMELAYSRSG